jgi:hypothetical protein
MKRNGLTIRVTRKCNSRSGLGCQSDGQLHEALWLLIEAQKLAKDIPYLRCRIELWLSKVHLML